MTHQSDRRLSKLRPRGTGYRLLNPFDCTPKNTVSSASVTIKSDPLALRMVGITCQPRRAADYTFSTFAAIMAWANDRGLILSNPCERPGKLYRSQRADSIWLADDEAALKKVAPQHIWLAFLLAVWTGQRQGDLLRLTWTAYDGNNIRLKQSKGGRRVNIPVGGELKTALDHAAKATIALGIRRLLMKSSFVT